MLYRENEERQDAQRLKLENEQKFAPKPIPDRNNSAPDLFEIHEMDLEPADSEYEIERVNSEPEMLRINDPFRPHRHS